jgi:hypothetical protein
MTKRVQNFLLTLSGFLILAIVGLPASANALSANETETRRIIAMQEPLQHAADDLKAVIEKNASYGFAGLELDVTGKNVLLYWKGNVPLELREKMGAVKATVKVMPAKYSKAELDKQADKIMQDKRKFGYIHKVAVKTDGSGLEVGLIDPSKKGKEKFAVDTMEVVETEVPQLMSRRDDAPYYSGGGRITHLKSPNYEDVGCSMGFAAYKMMTSGTVWYPMPYMLTAEHCDNSTALGTAYYSGTESIGTSSKERPDLDSLAIQGNSAGRVYDGGVGDDTEFKKPVAGLANNYVGGYVCSSGSFTGVHCGIRITRVNVTIRPSGSNHDFTHMVEGKSVYGTAAIVVGDGDSGGPVFALGSDQSRVLGAGIISAGSGYAPCVATYDSVSCHDTIYFGDLGYTLSAYGLQLRTAETLYDQPQLVSLESHNVPGYYARHSNYLGFLSTAEWYDTTAKRDASFWIKRGLSSTGTISNGTISLEAFAPSNNYLRHENERIKLTVPNGTQLFRDDASFIMQSGLAGNGTVSFSASKYPNKFLRHRNFALYAEGGSRTDSLYVNDASWHIIDPLVYRD